MSSIEKASSDKKEIRLNMEMSYKSMRISELHKISNKAYFICWFQSMKHHN